MTRIINCAYCKEYFVSAWSEYEALKEREELYPGTKEEECVVICETCNIEFRKWYKESIAH